MKRTGKGQILKTAKRLRLGVWGLGRGASFIKTCAAQNIDVVAGCDFDERLRQRFLQNVPGAFVTDDADAFLAADIDAVLLATYCPAHAPDAIRCLNAGKHVLSEVTAFHTLAEGVALVEAVERSGLVYNLAENYPFTKPNMWLAAKWREGLFGELQYAEYEYVHECRRLCYTYTDGTPVQPGHTVHNWRSWLNFHYYDTHSLGPIMRIAGVRPTRVVALPASVRLPGYLPAKAADGMGAVAPSLITLSNGAVARNLMGATTNDSRLQRLWGTKGSAEINNGLFLRLGGAGLAPRLEVTPEWPALGRYADTMGHGGGDFWVLHQFASHVLLGEPAYFDVYTAADCTLPGILAFRSACANGAPQDVPDFRRKADRDRCRNDHFAQQPYAVKRGVFPAGADLKRAGQFTAIMKDLIHCAELCRGAIDWLAVAPHVKTPERVADIAGRFAREHDHIRQTFKRARALARAYPGSDGARVINEMLELADANRAARPSFLEKLEKLRPA